MQDVARDGRVRKNVRIARALYQEGGPTKVVRHAVAKTSRATGRVFRPGRRRESWQAVGPEAFDADWYARFYGLSSSQLLAGCYEHYLRFGAAHGLSASALEHEASSVASGALHGPIADSVRDDFDADWYVRAYPEVAVLCAQDDLVSPLLHYVTTGVTTGNSPNGWFDEQWYLRTYTDVALAKALGGVPSGFVHFQQFGRSEGRGPSGDARPTAEVFTGLTHPVAFDRLKLVEQVLDPFNYRVYPPTGTPRINFLVPTLDKDLMFGGYIAAMNFMNQLLDRGWQLRILIVDDTRATADRLTRQFEDHALGSSVLARAEVVTLARRSEVLDISTDDRFIAYSMWTAYHADVFAQAVGRRFVFFIQEFEPIFHHHDSWHAIGAAMYDRPHFAMFNNHLLQRYFREERLGVFRHGVDEGLASSVVFEHAMSIPAPPTVEQLTRGAARRLLFYGRPEAHAARNLFEVAVAGLRLAVSQGIFEGDWTFDGVGSLATEATVPLGRDRVLNLSPRLPLGGYVDALRWFDVGLSMQYAPHPGVVHFEMAGSGMAVVTNTFSNRTAADLRELSGNLIGVEPTPQGVARGLAEAVAMSHDIEARAKAAATGPWVTDWAQSFNDEVMAAVESELR